MNTAPSRHVVARSLAAFAPCLLLAGGCATLTEDYGPPESQPVPNTLRYYEEQVRILRDRVNGLEREMEALRTQATDGTRAASATETARLARIESRISELDRAREADRAVIVDEVIAEIEILLRQPSGGTSRAGPGGTYTVQKGDTLWSIARRHGTTVRALQQANGLSETDVLPEGRQILIP